VADYQKFGGKK
jgi:histidyl-tRNA synthetase